MTAATGEALRDLWEADIERAGSEAGPNPIITSPPETTWIWSDLHFGDRSALEAFDRPFADVLRMNNHLLLEWRSRVRAGKTIICLGDVAHPGCVARPALGPRPPGLSRRALHRARQTTTRTARRCRRRPGTAVVEAPRRDQLRRQAAASRVRRDALEAERFGQDLDAAVDLVRAEGDDALGRGGPRRRAQRVDGAGEVAGEQP